MAKIAIDARFYGTGHTGLGRYTNNVLTYLPQYLRGHLLQVLLRDDEVHHFPDAKNVIKVRAEVPHYSLAEQLQLPGLLASLKSDLLYTFHFNTPIFTKIPKVVTVHDLIKSHFVGKDTTTRSPFFYAIKRFGYNQVISHTLINSSDIIVPTNTVKNDILCAFPKVKPENIYPIAEAPDEIFRGSKPLKLDIPNIPNNYLLFVGNAYPHKNLKIILEALKTLKDEKLVIVAKNTPFLAKEIAPYDPSRYTILSDLKDAELVEIYRRAKVLITPSFMEGYGLTGLEALMVGTPVIASNIPVYREVYGNSVTFFDPKDANALVGAIRSVGHKKLNKLNFDRTWDDVARSIAEVINARCTRL